MAKIYRTTDKITYHIGDIEVKISPLNVHDKAELHEYMTKALKGDAKAALSGSVFALKAGVKAVSGLEDMDGNPYKLEFDGNYLSDKCVDDLLNLEESNKLITICSQLISGIPKALPDGVTVDSPKN